MPGLLPDTGASSESFFVCKVVWLASLSGKALSGVPGAQHPALHVLEHVPEHGSPPERWSEGRQQIGVVVWGERRPAPAAARKAINGNDLAH